MVITQLDSPSCMKGRGAREGGRGNDGRKSEGRGRGRQGQEDRRDLERSERKSRVSTSMFTLDFVGVAVAPLWRTVHRPSCSNRVNDENDKRRCFRYPARVAFLVSGLIYPFGARRATICTQERQASPMNSLSSRNLACCYGHPSSTMQLPLDRLATHLSPAHQRTVTTPVVLYQLPRQRFPLPTRKSHGQKVWKREPEHVNCTSSPIVIVRVLSREEDITGR